MTVRSIDFLISGAVATSPVYVFSDTLTLSDSVAVVVTKSISDGITITDAATISKSVVQTFSDSITVSDSYTIAKNVILTFSDTITFSDNAVINSTKTLTFSDTITFSDSAAVNKTLNVSDTISTSDAFTSTHAVVKNFSDTISFSDSAVVNKTLNLSDTITTSDSFSKAAAVVRNFSDTVSFGDTFKNQDTIVISSQPITFTDYLAIAATKNFADTLTLSDSAAFAVTKPFSDTLTLTDSAEITIGKSISDSLTLTDSYALDKTKTVSDALTLSDAYTISRNTVKAFSDTLTLSDTFSVYATKAFSDSLTFSDTFSIITNTTFQFFDSITFSDNAVITIPISPNLVGRENYSGPVTGGDSIALIASGLDQSGVEDKFTSSTLNGALWSAPVLTGSAQLNIIPGTPRGNLQLSTGLTASSAAYLRSAFTRTIFDVAISEKVSTLQLRSGTAQVSLSLGAYVSSSTYLRATVELTKTTAQLHIFSAQNGDTLTDITLPVSFGSSKAFGLRLLRIQSQVFVFLNNSLVYNGTWMTDAAQIEIGVANDASGTSAATALITNYVRNPVVLFGAQPMLTSTSKSPNRVDVLTPPQANPGEQTITAYVDSLTGLQTIYFPVPYLYTSVYTYPELNVAGTASMVDTSDLGISS